MALVKCKECGNSYADTADSCPQCGAVSSSSMGCFLAMVAVFVIVLILAGLGYI